MHASLCKQYNFFGIVIFGLSNDVLYLVQAWLSITLAHIQIIAHLLP